MMSNDPKNKTKKQSSKPQSAVRSHYDQAGGCSYSHAISLGPRLKTNPSTDHCQYTGSMQYMRRMRSWDKTNVICLALFPGHVGTRAAIYIPLQNKLSQSMHNGTCNADCL